MKILRFIKNIDLKNKIAISVFIGVLLGSFLLYSRDVSLEYNFWIKGISFSKPIYQNGDYIHIDWVDNTGKQRNLVKIIKCSPGQKINNQNNLFYCDDNLIATALDVDKNGKKLPKLKINKIIPEGFYFVMGTHPRSYDSRYFGLIPEENIIRKLYPISKYLGF